MKVIQTVVVIVTVFVFSSTLFDAKVLPEEEPVKDVTLNQSLSSNEHILHVSKEYMSENENENHDVNGNDHHGVTLIGWEWQKLKNIWLFSIFLLAASTIKIAYHHSHYLSRAFPESCVLILIGVIFGIAIHFAEKQSEVPKFTVNLFFYALLPPIILESAYSLHHPAFLANLGTILLYAIVGTLINIILIGSSLCLLKFSELEWLKFPSVPTIEIIIFATAVSAVDPVSVLAIFQDLSVNKPLYFLVFGESLLNDAVVVVIHRLMTAFSQAAFITAGEVLKGILAFFVVNIGGFTIGVFFGLCTTLATLKTKHVRVVEPMVVIVLAYLSFITAEILHWSGIISMIGCGLFQAEYAFRNISRKSHITVKYCSRTLSSISDLLIFFFLGTILINEASLWNTSFVLFSTLFCIVFRFVSVFSLTFIANNFFNRLRLIDYEEQILMAYGGLRGAVAFALIAILDEAGLENVDLFRTATLFIIIFTVFIMGSTTKPLLIFLRIKREEKDPSKLFRRMNEKVFGEIMYGIEEIMGTKSLNYYWMHKLIMFNENHIRKYLTRDKEKKEQIETIFKKIAIKDGYRLEIQRRRKSNAFESNSERRNSLVKAQRATSRPQSHIKEHVLVLDGAYDETDNKFAYRPENFKRHNNNFTNGKTKNENNNGEEKLTAWQYLKKGLANLGLVH